MQKIICLIAGFASGAVVMESLRIFKARLGGVPGSEVLACVIAMAGFIYVAVRLYRALERM